MAVPRQTTRYLTDLNALSPNHDALDVSVSNTAIYQSCQGASNGSQDRTFTPGALGAGAAGTPTPARGWFIRASDFLNDVEGRTYIKAGTVTFTTEVISSNSAATLGTPSMRFYIGFYDVDPANPSAGTLFKSHTGIVKNIGPAVTGGSTQVTETFSMPEHLFERGRVLLVSIGGQFTSPNGTVAANTSTFNMPSGGTGGTEARFTGLNIGVKYDRELDSAATGAAPDRLRTVRKTLQSLSSGFAAMTRLVQAYRSMPTVAAASAQRPLLYVKLPRVALSAASASRPVLYARLSALTSGASMSTPEPIKAVRKAYSAILAGTGAAGRALQAYRSLETAATGTTLLARAFIGVRSFSAQATASAFGRIEVPMERIPFGGQVQQVIKRVIQVFDD